MGSARTMRYKIWLLGHWLEQIFFPAAREMTDTTRRYVLLGIMFLAIGVPVNYYLFSSWSKMEANAAEESSDSGLVDTQRQAEASPVTAVEHAAKHMDPTFVCPMHPDIVTTEEGSTCPICGMDLVLLESNGDADIVSLSPTIINTLGVRLDKVKRRTIYRKIDSVGYVAYNENNVRTIALRTEGWVEKLAVKSVGERVKKGDLLFELYSPVLVNSQEEFLQALELDGGDGVMLGASRDRLLTFGVSAQQIGELAETKKVNQYIKVFAPQDGVVTELNVREGMFVQPAKAVASLADLSSVWLMVDVFEKQVDWVKEGQSAEARLSFMPDKVWEGTVEYIYPELDPKTRSVKARLRFDNIEASLKPNMYADISIFAQPKRKVLTVPRESVIRQGNQSRVIVHMGDGKFKPVIVHAGIETDDKIEILGGLDEEQEVVVSSQFLIDSESSMRAALMRMTGH